MLQILELAKIPTDQEKKTVQGNGNANVENITISWNWGANKRRKINKTRNLRV